MMARMKYSLKDAHQHVKVTKKKQKQIKSTNAEMKRRKK